MDTPELKASSKPSTPKVSAGKGLKSASSSSASNQNMNQNMTTSRNNKSNTVAAQHNVAVQTAQVIAANNNHPKQRDVSFKT